MDNALHEYLVQAKARRKQAIQANIPVLLWRYARSKGTAISSRDLTVYTTHATLLSSELATPRTFMVTLAENWLHGSCAIRALIENEVVFEAEGRLDINCYLSSSPLDTPPIFHQYDVRVYRPSLVWEKALEIHDIVPQSIESDLNHETYVSWRLYYDWAEWTDSVAA